MENTFEKLDDIFISYLQIYNMVNKNQKLVEMAKELKIIEKETKNNKLKAKLITSSKMIEIEQDNFFKNFQGRELSLSKIIPPKKPVTIYFDGVFDIIHSGHFNAIRQAKKLGDILIVGINSDEEVTKAKGPTIMNGKERAELARACKWCDIIMEDTPYTPTIALIDSIGADYAVHGDDMPLNEKGENAYDNIMKAGRLKIIKRTEGVSTTEIIGRLLSCTKEIRKKNDYENKTSQEIVSQLSKLEEYQLQKQPMMSSFLATSHRIAEFSNNIVPKDTDQIVYIDGAFDILHIGHIETLKRAKAMGDFLYVGIHDDDTINKYRGKNYPILNLNERTFNLLALKYVDEVIVGAPWKITEDMIKMLKINTVVQGTLLKYDDMGPISQSNLENPYKIAKELGIYKEIPSQYDLTNEILVQRLLNKREMYLNKYLNKAKRDEDYLSHQHESKIKEI